MTANPQGVVPAVGEEPLGPPAPVISPASPAEPSATTGPDTDAIVERLMQRLKTELDPVVEAKVLARMNSMKDKRLAKVDEILEFVKQAGGDPNKVQGPLTIRTLEDRLQALESPAPAATPGRVAQGDNEARTAEFLNNLKDESGIAFTDDELKAIWNGKRYTRIEDAFKDVRNAAWKKAKQANVGAGAAVGSPGGQTAEGETDEELAAKFEEVSRNPVSRAAELKRVQAELRKRGLLK